MILTPSPSRVSGLIFALVAAVAAQAATITQWSFNSAAADANPASGTFAPNVGGGVASLVGGVVGEFVDATGSGDPVTGDDSGWSISGFAPQGMGNRTRGVQFAVSTVGHEAIVIRWDQRHSNTAARDVAFQYSLDGLQFTDFGPLLTASAGSTWFLGRTVDLSSVPAVNDNPDLVVRILASFSEDGSAYAASAPTSSYGTTGTWRFDMVTVSGTPLPVPEAKGSFAGLTVLVAALGLGLRKQGERKTSRINSGRS